MDSPEKIDVLVAFIGHNIVPKIIRWRQKKYLIKNVNLTYQEKIGQQPIFCFAVSDKNDNYFDIAYYPTDQHWEIRNLQWS
jgi:hypothetical protein